MLGNNCLWNSHASTAWQAEALRALLLEYLSKDMHRGKNIFGRWKWEIEKEYEHESE